MRCLVLGAGVVGEAVAWDLTHQPPVADVTLADLSEQRLAVLRARLPVMTTALDVSKPDDLEHLAMRHDVVVGALPSTIGFGVLERLCRIGARCCDVSFMQADAGTLDPVATAHGAVGVFDCGVAPGLSHVLVGTACAGLASVARVRIDVGGVPERPAPPFFYKAPFAPLDVIEEYTRPVHVVRGGQHMVVDALSGAERIEVDGVGALDAFYTDGLRSLVRTMQADDLGEFTLRHPGHLPVIQALATAGFFDGGEVTVNGREVRPRDVTAALLLPHWRYDEGERDVTVLRVRVDGQSAGGEPVTRCWQMVDRPDVDATGTLSSMARTTGFPAAIVARWLADGLVDEPGVHAPEMLGLRGLGPALIEALAARGVRVRET
jgi:lysine 6-dehydrogenase